MPTSIRQPTLTEKQLQAVVVNLARLLNWRVYHTFLSIRSAPGFPDCCMVRGDRLLFAELKSATGKVSEAQLAWLLDLKGVGAETHVWRPEHWFSGEIEACLR